MSDGKTLRGDAFAAVDARLTVFALANGMDLAKPDGARQLAWFSDGLERGLRIEPDPSGGFRVEARAWPFGQEGGGRVEERAAAVAPDRLTAVLESAIEAANRLELP